MAKLVLKQSVKEHGPLVNKLPNAKKILSALDLENFKIQLQQLYIKQIGSNESPGLSKAWQNILSYCKGIFRQLEYI